MFDRHAASRPQQMYQLFCCIVRWVILWNAGIQRDLPKSTDLEQHRHTLTPPAYF